jgi:hypothetical protein
MIFELSMAPRVRIECALVMLLKVSLMKTLTTSGYWMTEHPTNRKLELALRGAFLPTYYGKLSTKYLSVWIQLVEIASGFKPVANLSAFRGNNIIFAMVSTNLFTEINRHFSLAISWRNGKFKVIESFIIN